MFAIFSTREIATMIWLIAIIVVVLLWPKTQNSARYVLKAACTPKLYIPFVIILIYASFLVYVLSFMDFWKWQYLKDVSFWVLFAGIPLCYNAAEEKAGENYFRNMILNNLKLVVLVEFIIGLFTFNLIVELILIPVITFLVLIDVVADTEEEFALVKKLISFLMTFGGMIFIGFTIVELVNSYRALGGMDLLVTFFIPIFFSFMFIPMAYGLAVYVKYDSLFCRMSFKEPNDKGIKRKHRIKIIKACGLSIKKIIKFQKIYAIRIYASMTQQEFDDLIKEFGVGLK